MKGNMQRLISKELYFDALSIYEQQHACAHQPTTFTFPFLLKVCGKLQSPTPAQQIHAHIAKSGFQNHIFTATALTDAYMKLRMLDDALKVFDNMPFRNLPSFNSVICGFAQNGCFKESFSVFRRLEEEGFRPNSVTFAGALSACGTAVEGSQVHGLSIKTGHEFDVYVTTALVSMYSNCREIDCALRTFRLIPTKNVVSYNAMISGLSWNAQSEKALGLFQEMVFCSPEKPDISTFLSILPVCSNESNLSVIGIGKQVHCYLLRHGLVFDVKIGTAVLDMYAKCGSWKYAQKVFMSLDERNLITWNSMISGFLSHGYLEASLELFQQLETEGLEPDLITWNLMISGVSQNGNKVEAYKLFRKMQLSGVWNPSLEIITSMLEVCCGLADHRHGKEIHGHAIRTSKDGEHNEFFCTALAHFYMKCGSPIHACRIFDGFKEKSGDQALWNAMISGYGKNGDNESAIELFRKMLEDNIKPNSATFLSILSVCAHAGLVEKGWEMFRMMSRDYGLYPKAEHFGCMIDLLGRAGRLNEAWDLVQEIPSPHSSVYFSLLGACKCHSNAELGALVARRLLEIEPGNPTPMVILSNIYAEQGRWNDVKKLRETMTYKGLKKDIGCSWIDAKQQTTQIKAVSL